MSFSGDMMLVEEEPEATYREDMTGKLVVVKEVEYTMEEFWDDER
jgi:hypothetical protein